MNQEATIQSNPFDQIRAAVEAVPDDDTTGTKCKTPRFIPPGFQRNTPCEHGKRFGAELARLTDAEEPAYAAEFARDGKPVPQRCSTCAFRAGTFPNGCLSTVADAFKCVMELDDFCCHDKDAMTPEGAQVCVGWAILVGKTLREGKRPVEMPYGYSRQPEESSCHSEQAR